MSTLLWPLESVFWKDTTEWKRIKKKKNAFNMWMLAYCCLIAFWIRWTLQPVFLRSPQDDSNQSAAALCCPQTSIPLLMACTANVKTVVANPIVYLTNLTHDILQTINALDSPPHPDVVNNKVKEKQHKKAQLQLLAFGCWLLTLCFCTKLSKGPMRTTN